MVKIDIKRFISDRVWFGMYWMPGRRRISTSHKKFISERFTISRPSGVWVARRDWRPWTFFRFRYGLRRYQL